MNCTNCGHPFSFGNAFCGECGTPTSLPEEPTRWLRFGLPRGPVPVPWRAGQVGISIVIVAVVALLVAQLLILWVGTEDPALLALLTSVVLGLVILGAVWLAGLLPYRTGLAVLGFTRPSISGPRLLLLTGGMLLLSLAATAVYSIIVESIGIEILSPPDIPTGIVFSGGGAVFTFLALAVWTPITEEIFFRGFIFAGLTPRLGATRAMVASALIFSAFHIVPGVMIPIFVTGLLLAWLYRQTGSIWPGIAAHAGQNAVALLVTMLGF